MNEENSTTSYPSNSPIARRPVTVKMVQNVLLIWVDNGMDDNNDYYQNTITQLRGVVNSVNTFSDTDQCIDFLTDIENERVFFIISGALCQSTVPLIHDVAQLDSIFIFCENRTGFEEWIKEWFKIKGVFAQTSLLCEALKQVAQQCEHNAISISFMATSSDASSKIIDQVDSSFMYTQILKEIILTIKFEEKQIKTFIKYCREQFAENKHELNNINQLEQKYRDKRPIWWYTYECFLYPMLNRALRLMDVDIIIKMGFFIKDLHCHIEELHMEQFIGHHTDRSFTVYRGQGMWKTDYDQMTNTKGGLMSFNNFLSTSRDRIVSLQFARRALSNPDLVGILFFITIDHSILSTPFASINRVSYFQTENEVLFSMHTVFRIRAIKSMAEHHRLFQVDLTVTNDNDKDLRMLTDRMREETKGSTGWHRLGLLLRKMGQFDKAQEVYQDLLDQTTSDSEKAFIYVQIGTSKRMEGKYDQAITFYEEAHDIYKKTLPSNHIDLALFYINIGNVYAESNDVSKTYSRAGIAETTTAMSYYIKGLEISQNSLHSNDIELAVPYNNIGWLMSSLGEYSQALLHYEKALKIRQQSLPSTHPDLGDSYDNIGVIYEKKGEYSKALSFYERAVDIAQRSLPANHPNLQKWRKHFENIKKKL